VNENLAGETVSRPVIAVLDYGIGNLRSAERALEHCGADAHLTSDPGLIADADSVVLPGVGNFGACMRAVRAAGLDGIAVDAAGDGRPFLGICVGMQMLFSSSEEAETEPGLGIIPGVIRWIPPGVKRPQMQWNRLSIVPAHAADPMFSGLGDAPWMYFVHSLHGVPDEPADVAATVEYGATLNAAFRRGSVFATQFHPEKSATAGLLLLTNFVKASRRAAVGG
jgi:imidazole glycerol-phosphate synthase subunit HisH